MGWTGIDRTHNMGSKRRISLSPYCSVLKFKDKSLCLSPGRGNKIRWRRGGVEMLTPQVPCTSRTCGVFITPPTGTNLAKSLQAQSPRPCPMHKTDPWLARRPEDAQGQRRDGGGSSFRQVWQSSSDFDCVRLTPPDFRRRCGGRQVAGDCRDGCGGSRLLFRGAARAGRGPGHADRPPAPCRGHQPRRVVCREPPFSPAHSGFGFHRCRCRHVQRRVRLDLGSVRVAHYFTRLKVRITNVGLLLVENIVGLALTAFTSRSKQTFNVAPSSTYMPSIVPRPLRDRSMHLGVVWASIVSVTHSVFLPVWGWITSSLFPSNTKRFSPSPQF